jgi:acetyl-CoA carboxylase biotin carboxyl carrier protein
LEQRNVEETSARRKPRLNLRDLRELLALLAEREITEFELEEEGMKLRIRKAAAVASSFSPAAPADAPAAAPAAAVATAPAPPAPSATVEAGAVAIKSPIVGTFYRSPDPNSAPFVNVGDKVQLGQVVCIIEAMKLMNEIEADVAGEIVRIHQENGQPVQFGDPLFSIRPN